jgi:hypothetical protein
MEPERKPDENSSIYSDSVDKMPTWRDLKCALKDKKKNTE